MIRTLRLTLAAVFMSLGACAYIPQLKSSGVERLYVFNCGDSTVTDVSRWTPGANAGKPAAFSANCYVIQHSSGLMVWDSGINDSVASMPNGFQRGPATPHYTLAKPFRQQLSGIGIAPESVAHVAFSHTHGDHVGNANLFTKATVYMQQAEYDAAFGPDAVKRYNFEPENYEKLRGNTIVKLNGDRDVFGDGSVVILSTPGHTPGHQSLLVRLPKRGPVILSGDAVHLQENWVAKRVPAFNFDREQSLASMQKIARVMSETHAELWINHDKAQSDAIPKAPAFIE
jgi:N-acyl homoserine lactone hydrolase